MTRLFFIYLALLLSVCAYAKPKRERLRLYLDWTPNVEFAGIYAAMEKGWYEQAGIDLQTVFHGLDIIPNVLKGDADVGMHSGHDLIRYAGEGKKLEAIAAQFQLNPNSIVVAPDSGITRVEDLRGKTLGIFSEQEYGMFRIILGFHGLRLADVHFKPIHTFKEAELVELLRQRKVDGFIAWEFTWTVTFALLGYPVRTFPGYDHGFNYYGIVYFASPAYVTAHRDLLKRFLRVTFDGWREVFRQPDYWAAHIVDKYYPKSSYLNGSRDLTLRQQKLELKLRQRYFFEGVGRERIGMMSKFKWRKAIEISKRFGLISPRSHLKPEDIFDNSLMAENLEGAQ